MPASLPATLNKDPQNNAASATVASGQNSFADVFGTIQSSSGGKDLAAGKLGNASNPVTVPGPPKNAPLKKKDIPPSLPTVLAIWDLAANRANVVAPGTVNLGESASVVANEQSNQGQIVADTNALVAPQSPPQTNRDACIVSLSGQLRGNATSGSGHATPVIIARTLSDGDPEASQRSTTPATTGSTALPLPSAAFGTVDTVAATVSAECEPSSQDVSRGPIAVTGAINPDLATISSICSLSQTDAPKDPATQDATHALASASTSDSSGTEQPILALDQTLQIPTSTSPGATQPFYEQASSLLQHPTIKSNDACTQPHASISLNEPDAATTSIAPPVEAALTQTTAHAAPAFEMPVTLPDLAINSTLTHVVNRAQSGAASAANAPSDTALRPAVSQSPPPDPTAAGDTLLHNLAVTTATPQDNAWNPSQPDNVVASSAPVGSMQPQKPASKTSDLTARTHDASEPIPTEGLSAAQTIPASAAIADIQPAQALISSATSSGAIHPASPELPSPTNAHAAPLTGAAIEIEVASPAETGSVRIAQITNHIDESQMRVGLTTAEFGNIEILSTVHASSVGLLVGSERGDLHTLLAAEMPLIQRNLEQHNLRLENVHFDRGQQFSSQSGANADAQKQRAWKNTQGNIPTDHPLATEPILSRNSFTPPAHNRLSILA